LIVVIAGPGGVGKDTISEALCAEDDRFVLSRSWTTRPRRPGDGPNAYTFVDRATFERRIAEGGFLEWAEYHGNLYGTPRPEPLEDRHLVLNIEIQGARQIIDMFPDETFMVLLEPPSQDVLTQRLRGRGDEEEAVQRRVAAAFEELAEGRGIAHAVVVNDDLTQAIQDVRRILEGRLSGASPE
jgi:guanylate kinase